MMVMIETLNNHQDLLLPVFHNLHYYRHQVARRILLKEKTKIQSKCQSKKDKSIFFLKIIIFGTKCILSLFVRASS